MRRVQTSKQAALPGVPRLSLTYTIMASLTWKNTLRRLADSNQGRIVNNSNIHWGSIMTKKWPKKPQHESETDLSQQAMTQCWRELRNIPDYTSLSQTERQHHWPSTTRLRISWYVIATRPLHYPCWAGPASNKHASNTHQSPYFFASPCGYCKKGWGQTGEQALRSLSQTSWWPTEACPTASLPNSCGH